MTLRFLGMAILLAVSFRAASAQGQLSDAPIDNESVVELHSIRDVLRGSTQEGSGSPQITSDALSQLEPIDASECESQIQGQFVFVVRVPVRVSGTQDVPREEFRTCLVYDEETCCHEWKKYKVTVIETVDVSRIEMRKRAYCVKLSVPIEELLEAEDCDCLDDLNMKLHSLTQLTPIDPAGQVEQTENEQPSPAASSDAAQKSLLSSADSARTRITRRPVGENPAPLDGQLRLHEHQLSEAGNSTVQVRNAGTDMLRLKQLTFRPTDSFKVAAPHADSLDADMWSAGATGVLLSNSHNTAHAPGKHATYEVTIGEPLEVAAGATHRLTLRIANNEHLGWGFIGELNVGDGDGVELLIPNVRVLFVREGTFAGS